MSKLFQALGMEDDAPNVQVNIDTDEGGMPLDDVTAEGEPTPEADAAEMEADAAEIAADDEQIEELEEAQETLESYLIAMESAQKNGGLTDDAAQIMAIGLESIMGKYGYDAQEVGMASLESWGDNRSNKTTVSMEGIRDTLRTIWEAIVKKIKELFKKITDFYHKNIGGAARLKRRAEGIRKKAKKERGTPKDKTITPGLFRSLNLAGKVPEGKELVEALELVKAPFVKNINKSDWQDKVDKTFDEIKSNLGTNPSSYNIDSTNTALENLIKTLTDAQLSAQSDPIGGVEVREGAVIDGLPGNKQWFIGYRSTTDKPTAAQKFNSLLVGIYADDSTLKAKDSDKDKKFDVLGLGSIDSICGIVIDNMESIINNKTQKDRAANYAKVIEKRGKDFVSELEDDKHKANDAQKVVNAYAHAAKEIASGQVELTRYVMSTNKAALAWCSRSLSNYQN